MTTPPATTARPALPALVTLATAAILLGLAAVVTGWIGAAFEPGYSYAYGGKDPSDIALKAALSWWSNLLAIFSVVTATGAIVLGGVQELLRRAGLSI